MLSVRLDNVKLNQNFEKYFQVIYYQGGYSYKTGSRYDFHNFTLEKCSIDHFTGVNKNYFEINNFQTAYCLPKNYSTPLLVNGTDT